MKQVIQFSGISRQPEDALCNDGAMMELINAKVINGSVVPVIPDKLYLKASGMDIKKAYIHHYSTGQSIIVVTSSAISEAVLDQTKENIVSLNAIKTITQNQKVEINHVGSVLILLIDGVIHYVTRKTGSYIYLGTNIPVPSVKVTYSEQKITHNLSDSQYVGLSFSKKTLISFMIGEIERNILPYKSLYGSYMLRWAIKLVTGGYIYPSAPVIITSSSAHECNFAKYSLLFTGSGDAEIDLRQSSFSYLVNDLTATIDASNLTSWADIVQSIDFFISPRIYPLESDYIKDGFNSIYGQNITGSLVAGTGTGFGDDDGRSEKYNTTTKPSRYKEPSNYYRVGEFKLSDIQAPKSVNPIGQSMDEIKKNLVNLPRLTADESSFKKTNGVSLSVYNSRVHLANITNELYAGYPFEAFNNPSTTGLLGGWQSEVTSYNKSFTLYAGSAIYVLIASADGERWVKTTLESNINSFTFAPYFFYPDSRAKMAILKIKLTASTFFTIEIQLRAHDFMDMAYYIRADLRPISNNRPDSGVIQFDPDTWVSLGNKESIPNMVKCTQVNNPFTFNVENSYIIGRGKIIGLSSNTTAISQGQFGQHPMIVFTDEGIYALQQGTGTVAYSIVSPLSREVCVNGDSITPIDNAIVFATDSAIMLLDGATTTNLSDPLDSDISPAWLYSDILSEICLDAFSKDVGMHTLKSYIENCKIAYSYMDKELIVSNSYCNYSFIYSFKTGQWHKESTVYTGYINDYPMCYGLTSSASESAIYHIYNKENGDSEVLAITRPLKLGGPVHKRVNQVAIRSFIQAGVAQPKLQSQDLLLNNRALTVFNGFKYYLLGSDDCVNFSLIKSGERRPVTTDIISSGIHSKPFKYYIVAMAGNMNSSSKLSYCEIGFELSLNNKLR